jgi:integrase
MNMYDMNPSSLVKQSKENIQDMEDLLMDFVSDLHKQEYSPAYIQNYLKAIKSWLQFNGVTLVRKIKIGNRDRTPTIEDERIPTKAELKQILNYAEERGSCSISFMAFSGLRPQSLGDMTGRDGLKLKDLPELEIKDDEASFNKIPSIIVVRPELSKAKHKYLTFIGPEGCEHLKAYFEKRMAEGEKLDENSAVISYKAGYEDTGFWDESMRTNRHVTTKTLTKEIRDAMRPKYKWRPYVLRAYFDTQLLVAENNGRISHAYRQFFMGHKGDMEARYTTNKGRLPENLIEDMRSSYGRCLEYLETRKSEVSDDRLHDALRRQLLLVAGFNGDEIDGLDMGMSDEEFQETVRRKLLGSMVNNGNNQRVVSIDDVEMFLGRGWNFVAKLTDEKAILRLP